MAPFINDDPGDGQNAAVRTKFTHRKPRIVIYALEDLEFGQEVFIPHGEDHWLFAFRNPDTIYDSLRTQIKKNTYLAINNQNQYISQHLTGWTQWLKLYNLR